jgi:hypothetical protein
MLVDFGQIDVAKGAKTTLNLYAARGETPMEVEIVSISLPELKAEVALDPDFPEMERSRHLIQVEVPAGLPPQRRTSTESGTILLRTTNPEVPEFKIHVSYESR